MARILRVWIVFLFLGYFTSGVKAQLNERYFYYVGQGLIIDGKYNEAVSMLNMLLRVDETSYEGFFLRGIAKYNLGDYVGAESDFSFAIEVNSVFTNAYHYRAISRSFLGKYDEAVKDFDIAIDIRPDREGIYYSRGITFFMNQQFDRAISDFDYYIRKKPYVVDAYVNRGSCYLMKSDTTQAFNDYNKAVLINKYDPDGYMRRGGLYLAMNELDSAYKDLSKSIELDTMLLAAYFNRAIVSSNKNRPTDAIADFTEVVKLDTMNSLTYFNRALVYSQIGDYTNALKDYKKVEEYSPSNVLLYYNRGGLNMQLGDLESAEEDFTKAIEVYPDFANAYLNRSSARYQMGDMEGSKSDKLIADMKIQEYKSKLVDSTFSQYADTSKFFNKLISFDVDFGNDDFENVKRNDIDIRLLPMFRFAYAKEYSLKKNLYYSNDEINDFKSKNKFDGIEFAIRSEIEESKSIELLEEYEQKSNKRNASWQDLFELAVIQSELHQYSRAVASFTKIIKMNPDNAFLYVNRAVVHVEMIEFITKLEEQSSKIVIDASPENVLKASRRIYSYQEAIDDMLIAIQLEPNIAQLYYNLGNLLSLEGKQIEAIDAYTKAIGLNSSLGESYFNRGMIQLHLKDTQKGYLDISKAGELGMESAYELLERFK